MEHVYIYLLNKVSGQSTSLTKGSGRPYVSSQLTFPVYFDAEVYTSFSNEHLRYSNIARCTFKRTRHQIPLKVFT